MSDLSDLAEAVAKDLPHGVRKIIDTALENGWQLNPPGMTLALRLNHPTDELADPVYVVWSVGRTPTGKISLKFSSAGTRGLVPLKGPDLIEYLQDPTVAYVTAEEAEAEYESRRKLPPWDEDAPAEVNVMRQLNAEVVSVENERPGRRTAAQIMADAKKGGERPSQPSGGLRVTAPTLRVSPPSL